MDKKLGMMIRPSEEAQAIVQRGDYDDLVFILTHIEKVIERAAFQTLQDEGLIWDDRLKTFEGMTGPESRSIIIARAVQIKTQYDWATMMLEYTQGKKAEKYFGYHPNDYNTVYQFLRDNGASGSRYSNSKVLIETIFPFLEKEIKPDALDPDLYDPQTLYTEMGPGRLYLIIPHLRAIIDDDHKPTVRIQAEIEKAQDSIRVSEDTSEWDEEDWKKATVQWLIDTAWLHPQRELREQIRAGATPPVELIAVRNGDEKYELSGSADGDQLERLQRKGGDAVSIQVYR